MTITDLDKITIEKAYAQSQPVALLIGRRPKAAE